MASSHYMGMPVKKSVAENNLSVLYEKNEPSNTLLLPASFLFMNV
jgi:hypothetical protein